MSDGTNTSAPNRETILARVGEFGDEAAKGKDSLPKLGLFVLDAANQGLLDAETWPAVAGKDAVAQIYARYAEGARKTVHEHAPDSLKAQESKLRAFFRAGKHIQHGLDPVVEMDRVRERRDELFRSDPKNVKPAYAAYYAGALAILGTKQSSLTTHEIDTAAMKTPPKDKTVAQELAAIYKKAEALVTGDKGVKHASDKMVDIVEALRDELNEMGVDPEGKKAKDKNAPQPMGPSSKQVAKAAEVLAAAFGEDTTEDAEAA